MVSNSALLECYYLSFCFFIFSKYVFYFAFAIVIFSLLKILRTDDLYGTCLFIYLQLFRVFLKQRKTGTFCTLFGNKILFRNVLQRYNLLKYTTTSLVAIFEWNLYTRTWILHYIVNYFLTQQLLILYFVKSTAAFPILQLLPDNDDDNRF